jgi:hypothetical protein
MPEHGHMAEGIAIHVIREVSECAFDKRRIGKLRPLRHVAVRASGVALKSRFDNDFNALGHLKSVFTGICHGIQRNCCAGDIFWPGLAGDVGTDFRQMDFVRRATGHTLSYQHRITNLKHKTNAAEFRIPHRIIRFLQHNQLPHDKQHR